MTNTKYYSTTGCKVKGKWRIGHAQHPSIHYLHIILYFWPMADSHEFLWATVIDLWNYTSYPTENYIPACNTLAHSYCIWEPVSLFSVFSNLSYQFIELGIPKILVWEQMFREVEIRLPLGDSESIHLVNIYVHSSEELCPQGQRLEGNELLWKVIFLDVVLGICFSISTFLDASSLTLMENKDWRYRRSRGPHFSMSDSWERLPVPNELLPDKASRVLWHSWKTIMPSYSRNLWSLNLHSKNKWLEVSQFFLIFNKYLCFRYHAGYWI